MCEKYRITRFNFKHWGEVNRIKNNFFKKIFNSNLINRDSKDNQDTPHWNNIMVSRLQNQITKYSFINNLTASWSSWPSVIPRLIGDNGSCFFYRFWIWKVTNVPQLDALIFWIRYKVNTIILGIITIFYILLFVYSNLLVILFSKQIKITGCWEIFIVLLK